MNSAAELQEHKPLAAKFALFRDLAAETVERMPLGLVALDHELRVTYANDAALALTGMSVAELVGRRPWDLFPQVVGTQAQTVRRSVAITVEYEEQLGPGRHWVGVLACPIQTGTAVFLRDIAARSRAEETVRRSVALTHGLLDPLRDAFMLCSAVRDETDAIVDFRVDFANGIAGAFMRGVPDALMGALTSAMTPDWAANLGQRTFLDVCREVVETGEAWVDDAVEFAVPGIDGVGPRGNLSIQIARFNDGFFATWRDVTESTRLARERELLVAVVEQSTDGVVMLDVEGVVRYANARFLALSALRLENVVDHPAGAIALTMTGIPTFAAFEEAAGSALPWRQEIEQRGPDGTIRQLEVGMTPVRDAAASVTGYVATVRDVTQRNRAEREMRWLSKAIEQSADSVVITDRAGTIEYVNPAFTQVSGYARDEVIGQNPRILKSDVQGPAFYAAMWATLTGGQSFVGDITNRRKDGSLFEEEAVISPILDAAGVTTSYVAVKRDVTRERASEAARERLARERALIAGTLGSLNALPTPTATAEAICRQVLGLAGVASASISYFTLEGPAIALTFLRANGAPVALRRLPFQRSRVLRERAEEGPWVEKWVHRPWHPYDRLHTELGTRALAYAPVRTGGRLIGILTITSGHVDAIERLTETLPALLEFAGLAGALIGPALEDLTEVGHAYERIALIIKSGAFRPVFQPVVDLASGAHVGYEALTRFAIGTAPDLVFADARSAGLEAELELATLAAAIAAAAGLPAGAWLSLNVSPSLLTTSRRLAGVLHRADRPVVLEVTEHVAVADYAALRAALANLRPAVRVAVDDAGSGIANFSHIVELRPAFVKLDIGLVRGIDTDLTRRALMVGLLQFAKESASLTVAEGVETEEEFAMLQALEVPLAQGYLLGRPAPVAEWADGYGGGIGPMERRNRAAVDRQTSATARADATIQRLTVAGLRNDAATDRGKSAETPRVRASARDQIADVRDDVAAERDAIADTRDEAAADRDTRAGDRDAAARAHPGGYAADEEDARLESALQAAYLDDLTGLYRRGQGSHVLAAEIDRARRGDGRFVVAFLDVDALKRVNDRDGHAAGDRILTTLAESLRSRLRSFDVIIRYGGDEFVCGLGGIDLKAAKGRFAAIDRQLRATVGVGITVGLAALATDDTVEVVISRADAALLEGKRRRRTARPRAGERSRPERGDEPDPIPRETIPDGRDTAS